MPSLTCFEGEKCWIFQNSVVKTSLLPIVVFSDVQSGPLCREVEKCVEKSMPHAGKSWKSCGMMAADWADVPAMMVVRFLSPVSSRIFFRVSFFPIFAWCEFRCPDCALKRVALDGEKCGILCRGVRKFFDIMCEIFDIMCGTFLRKVRRFVPGTIDANVENFRCVCMESPCFLASFFGGFIAEIA